MKEILFAGLGGQGVILSASVLAKAATDKNFYAAQSQSYGSESRGTPTKAEVVFNTTFVDFPHVEHADFFLVMAETSYKLQKRKISNATSVLFDGSIFTPVDKVEGARYINIEATKMSMDSFGKPLYANIVMLGALCRLLEKEIDKDTMARAVADFVPEKALQENLEAFNLGYALNNL